jgi:nucleotide-binding universal stress UspA family protein
MEAIVVGVDGSDASLDALSWADHLAWRTGAELLAVRADLPRHGSLSPSLYTELADKARHQIGMWAKQRDLVLAPTSVVADEDPRAALVAVAAERAADLLVIGARGNSSVAGTVLGGVARHLTLHPERPLAVVPAGAAADTRHVVIGVDGSTGSAAAVQFCARLAKELDIPVTAVLAREPAAERLSPPGTDDRTEDEHQVRSWVEPIATAGVPLEVVVEHDVHPVGALTAALADHPGSLAVLGTRGRGGFAGLRLGRVPLQLLHHTTAPVVIVPIART